MTRLVFLGVTACLFGYAGDGSSDLASLYRARRWPELQEALRSGKGPGLYRGAVAEAFNDDRRAEGLLRSVITRRPHSEDAYQAYEWLAHLYFRRGRYRQFISTLEARWAAFPDKIEINNERAASAGFRDLPDQKAAKALRSIVKHEPGTISLPVSINGAPAKYFFDTGAWVNCMSESEANRLGLRIQDAAGTLGTSTGARVGFRIAVARELAVGRIHFQNVSFAIFGDDQEPWSVMPAGERGLLGIPVILGFDSLRWSQDGTVEIGFKPGRAEPRRSNLFFDDDHLVVAAGMGPRRILATLDTGAQTTDLYEAFAKDFHDLLSEGSRGATEVRGVGHAESFDSITLPELTFRIGGSDSVLRPAHVLLKQIGAKCCAGNFGLDLLQQGRAFKIDFRTMTLEIER